MTAYTELMTALAPTDSGFTAHVTPDWQQGRTTYGGLSAALCLEAATRAVPDAPPLRSGQFAFVGPAAGELAIQTTVLRRGKSTLFMGVDLVGEQGLATRAVLTFGAARQSRLSHVDLAMPAVPPAADCLDFFRNGAGPNFTQQFDFKVAGGTPIGTPGSPDFLVWIRHKDPAARSLAALIALADALPPPAVTLFPERAPISTMTWSLDVLAQPPLEDDGWRLMKSRADTVLEGYSAQDMAVWDSAGTPLIVARQNVAVFI
ncbi:acyl-CoA thioesterase [Caulobacter sp. Root655]|uniref:acyl-CoA thioesterase n=1 Tax=Caulobacter sp. Root655 TaxID=1736578 RepID=UPI0006FEBB01|nr:thioesterase family protein [Caulobacter sp. Root655]KRA56758.1 acyl-CoA thioesterase [Caulobacter sp. Root655]